MLHSLMYIGGQVVAAGGFRSFPPINTSWARSGSNPIISPVVAWEETCVAEPFVLYDGTWRMWYTGGWTHGAIGYATSTDGITWVKYASNPVYGQGASGYANIANCPTILRTGSTYWLFASGGTDTHTPFTTLRVATSTDGIAWTTQASSITIPGECWAWGNREVWQEGTTWKMLQECGGTLWQIYLYTSPDGLVWTIGNGGAALSTLQIAANGMYGGPTFFTDSRGNKMSKFGSLYHLWYHSAPGAGNLPTNIYHAKSSDLITWTPNLVLTYAGSGFEVDPVADPSIVVKDGTAFLYYDGMDNGASAGHIGLATANAVWTP